MTSLDLVHLLGDIPVELGPDDHRPMGAKGALQNEHFGCFVPPWRRQVGFHLESELRRKGVWGQTLKVGLSFLPVSVLKLHVQPRFRERKSRLLNITGRNYNILWRKRFSITTGILKLVKDLELFPDK